MLRKVERPRKPHRGHGTCHMNHICVLQDHAVNGGTAKLDFPGCELHIEAEPVRQTLGQSQTVESIVNVRHSDKQVDAWLRLGVELDATEALYRHKWRRRWWSEHLVAWPAIKDKPVLPTFGLEHEEKADLPRVSRKSLMLNSRCTRRTRARRFRRKTGSIYGFISESRLMSSRSACGRNIRSC